MDLQNRIAESRDRLYRVALAWCGDKMLADDLVQDTLKIGIINSAQLRDRTRLSAWLYTILHNNWCQYLRRSRPQVEINDHLADENQGPVGDYQQLQIVMRVRHAVGTLPMEQRQVISLVDLEELSYCEVSEVLGIPIGTVMSRLHRARKTLLSKMDSSAEESDRSPQGKSADRFVRMVK